ncbi:nitroreductase family protein [Paenibacillus spiritus]|uniref:Nitroreductase family protein n=1 Tax=Paenibacillus spiritus TaxID=2496557 RepID=A0A5J5G1S1_9BACL|nr:nitroreductase family protein [Paenibacillus spiritus]KAA8999817.1 nitroreductase family protein [Paenibacillus spiritus]
MLFEEFKQLALTRRSIRDFTEERVSPEDIRDLIDCARFAPSDTNSQTWEFIALLDRERIKQIETFTWEALRRIAAEAESNGLAREAKLMLKSFGPYATAFGGAPALILCLATPYTSKFRERIFDPLGFGSPEIWAEEGIKSSSLAVQNLMLAAHAKGLATCPMTGPVLLAERELRDYLGIPEERQVNMVLALGHPSVQPKAIARKGLDEILTIIE